MVTLLCFESFSNHENLAHNVVFHLSGYAKHMVHHAVNGCLMLSLVTASLGPPYE